MHAHRISVGPVTGGWEVRLDTTLHPMLFLSGGRAEEHARGLAARLSGAGQEAFVYIHDRSDALVGTMRFEPQSAASPREFA